MDQNSAGLFGSLFSIVMLAIAVVVIASMWKVFTKAGKPGWAVLVPIYNVVVLLQIVGKPIWWLILLLIPFVSLIIVIVLCISLAKCFGKSTGFGVGLALLGIVFFPILGFGDAKYLGAQAGA